MAAGLTTPIERHASLASTNALGLERARSGEREPAWIVADRQTAGRGRRGRTWISEPGNLYASHVVVHDEPRGAMGLMPLAAALALMEALTATTDLGPRFGLKWPNDVLVDGCKVAGILLEAEAAPDGGTAVVTGFGVNCRHAPDTAPYPVASLASLETDLAPEVLLAALDARWTAI